MTETKTQKAEKAQWRRNRQSRSRDIARESEYQRAAALWVARRQNISFNNVWGVTFAHWQHNYCETCGEPESGIEYYTLTPKGDLTRGQIDLGFINAGQFIEQCVALLPEVKR